jgi:hypothetical protein
VEDNKDEGFCYDEFLNVGSILLLVTYNKNFTVLDHILSETFINFWRFDHIKMAIEIGLYFNDY